MHIRHPSIRPPRIHWKKYLERKVIVLSALCLSTFIMETYFHMPHVMPVIHSFHDLTIGVLAEHLLFGIPLED